MSDTIEFEIDPWRLRAVFCADVQIENGGDQWPGNGLEDVWIWFVGDPILDEWFAHGLSDICTDNMAERIAASINQLEMLAMLAYAGESWAIITAVSAVAFASQQRALAEAMRGVPIDRLKRMTRDQILSLRKAESASCDPTMN